MQDILSRIVKANEANGKICEGDFYDENGRLFCGKCKEPKQTSRLIPIGRTPRRMFIPCRCELEEEERYRRRIEAQNMQDKIKALRRSGVMDAAYNSYTFENDDGRNPKITASCKRYADHWQEMSDLACGVLFYGGVGGGKSFYAGCIANTLIEQGVPALMTRLSYLVNNRVKADEPIRLSDYRLIVLDDIGTENISQTAFDVVNDIYLAKIPVICTTNLTLSELKSSGSIEKQRIYDRLLERCAKKCLVPVTRSRVDVSRELDMKAAQILANKPPLR